MTTNAPLPLAEYLAQQPDRCQHGTHPSQRAFHVCPELVDLINAETPLGKITDEEWATFTSAIREVARDGVVRQNDVRPLIRGRIFHKHIGSCYRVATKRGVLVEVAREPSADSSGRNTHHDSGVYRLGAAA